MTIVLSQSAFCGGADVCEYQGRTRLGCQAFEVFAVPRWQSGSKYARLWAQNGGSIESDAETITIDWTTGVLCFEF